MDWMRISVQVTPEAAEAAGEILRQAGCAGWEDLGPGLVVGYLPADMQTGERIADIWHSVRALAGYGLEIGTGEVHAEMIAARPWEEAWKAYFRPTRVGRVVICPTWEQVELGPDEVLVSLDPGMAFGSGAHATTRLCLQALADALPARGRVLDVGTGSGILAVAAARLGASRVLAVDNDPDVLPVATDNAALNQVADLIEVREGDIAAVSEGNWDVIVANIAPDPVRQAAPAARRLLAAAGVFIGGGIPATRAQEVQDALASAGLTVQRVLEEDEWVAVAAK